MEYLERNKGNLLVFLTAFLWSTGGILLKYVQGNPIAINGARSIIAVLFIMLYKRQFKITFNKNILITGLCMTSTNILYVLANKMTTAGNAIVLQYLAPMFVLIWDSIYYKRRPSIKQTLFVFIAIAGMCLFFLDSLEGGQLLGNILAIVSGLTFSGVFFMNSLEDTKTEDASMFGFILSFIVSIPFLTQLEYTNMASNISIVILGVFQIAVAYLVYAKACKMTKPVNASIICVTEAIMNPLWVYLFYGEKLGKYALIGAIVIMVSIVLNVLYTNENDG